MNIINTVTTTTSSCFFGSLAPLLYSFYSASSLKTLWPLYLLALLHVLRGQRLFVVHNHIHRFHGISVKGTTPSITCHQTTHGPLAALALNPFPHSIMVELCRDWGNVSG